MSWKKYLGVLTSAALVGAVAMANGCSSSSNKAGPGDGGNDGAVVHKDSGSSSGSSSGATGDDSGDDGGGSYDGTTGKACTTDADCHPAGGPGVNKCTADGLFGTSGGNDLYPTAVCLDIQNCDPGSDGNLHFCDGPDDPSSPGVCLSTGAAGKGICLPQCNFKPDGSAVTGCIGKDTCDVAGFEPDPNNANAAIGIGYCFGGCESNADCAAGQQCQTDSGLCLKTLTTDPAVGTGCNQNATPAPTCNCLANTSSGLGYCAQFCKIGGTSCGSGQICDAELPTELIGSNDASIPGWTTANPGLGGFCSPTCNVDAGTTMIEGGTCYPNSTCQAGDLGGPDCLP
jgi:hypothetical protein